MALNIKFFGPLRRYGDGITLPAKPGDTFTVDKLRALLKESINTHDKSSLESLLAASAVADNDRILSQDALIADESCLVLLPPVCGG